MKLMFHRNGSVSDDEDYDDKNFHTFRIESVKKGSLVIFCDGTEVIDHEKRFFNETAIRIIRKSL